MRRRADGEEPLLPPRPLVLGGVQHLPGALRRPHHPRRGRGGLESARQAEPGRSAAAPRQDPAPGLTGLEPARRAAPPGLAPPGAPVLGPRRRRPTAPQPRRLRRSLIAAPL